MICLKRGSIVNTSLLRKLRFFERVIMNIPFLLTWFLIFVMPMYFGVSQRLTFSFLLMFSLFSVIFGQRLGNLLYVRIFAFMKPLWEYEQQKSVSDKWKYVFAFLIIFIWIFVVIYPPPMPRQINWDFIICYLVVFNIVGVLRVLTEKFV